MGNNIDISPIKDNIVSCSPLLTKKLYQRKERKRAKVIKYLNQKKFGQYPVVDTLGISNHLFFRVLIHLSPNDLATCMLVCKEWRSLIDRCIFLKSYTHRRFDFNKASKDRKSILNIWRGSHVKNINFNITNERLNSKLSIRVFDKFPIMWKCGVSIPPDVLPPVGSILNYHYFIKAMNMLTSLYNIIVDCGLLHQYSVFLIPWKYKRLPASCEILTYLNFNERIIEYVVKEKYLTESEMRNYYNIIRPMYNGEKINKTIFDSFITKAPEKFIAFDCFCKKMEACPAFLASRLSDEWVGGIIYAV